MDFEKVITERYSVRKFNGERLKQSDIEKILAAGHKAPTIEKEKIIKNWLLVKSIEIDLKK